MSKLVSFDQFQKRHIGIGAKELNNMLQKIGVDSLDQLIEETVPSNIRSLKPLDIPAAQTELEKS